MFTGLIETTGIIQTIHRGNKSLEISIIPDSKDFSAAKGGSVSVDGVCLTVVSTTGQELYFTAVYETLVKTTVPLYRIGEKVNLERALRVGDRFDGHIVQGHVDGVGTIVSDQKIGDSIFRRVEIPESLRKFMAQKGSVALDGISLTIAQTDSESICVSLIPYTVAKTTISRKKVGDKVNIECDVLARYIDHLLRRDRLDTRHVSGAEGSAIHKNTGDGDLLTLLENSGF